MVTESSCGLSLSFSTKALSSLIWAVGIATYLLTYHLLLFIFIVEACRTMAYKLYTAHPYARVVVLFLCPPFFYLKLILDTQIAACCL